MRQGSSYTLLHVLKNTYVGQVVLDKWLPRVRRGGISSTPRSKEPAEGARRPLLICYNITNVLRSLTRLMLLLSSLYVFVLSLLLHYDYHYYDYHLKTWFRLCLAAPVRGISTASGRGRDERGRRRGATISHYHFSLQHVATYGNMYGVCGKVCTLKQTMTNEVVAEAPQPPIVDSRGKA